MPLPHALILFAASVHASLLDRRNKLLLIDGQVFAVSEPDLPVTDDLDPDNLIEQILADKAAVITNRIAEFRPLSEPMHM
ncbi:MAG TPA: hypothetical protein VH250_13330 [Granulicella sp.]|jgi:hypothetical protein|nr:hypothetical protein [Granulicella sp.]